MKLYISILLVSSILFTGCAHKISMSPPLDEIRDIVVEKKLDINVGYYISIADMTKEVVSKGGGGDKVTYTPYKDTESVLYTMLSKVFNRVYYVSSLQNDEYLVSKNIKYIFIPTIHTTSSSESMVTWPPTTFNVELKCQAIDQKGNEVWYEIVYVRGYATFDEFKSNFSLSAQRATKQAFKQMLIKLKDSNEFKNK